MIMSEPISTDESKRPDSFLDFDADIFPKITPEMLELEKPKINTIIGKIIIFGTSGNMSNFNFKQSFKTYCNERTKL
jgi:hypothetical protein